MSIQKVNSKDWVPVGNFVLLKPIVINKNELVPEHLQQPDGFEVRGFGTSYEAIEDLKIGDKVIVIEYDNKKEGTLINIAGEGELWCYPPEAIVAKIEEE